LCSQLIRCAEGEGRITCQVALSLSQEEKEVLDSVLENTGLTGVCCAPWGLLKL